MLMIYEKSTDIPTQMHVFYRKAFFTLFEEHDSNKGGGFRRTFQSGLKIDPFMNYFSEFCFLTYREFKINLTFEEFSDYFSNLTINDGTVTASAFEYDLRVNLCLMLLEGQKYYFIHRSFQEYFSALFMTRLDGVFFTRLGTFFENRHKQSRGDNVLKMLYDMIPNKVEKFILIPFLNDLFDKCINADGYWTFLEIMYPHIKYKNGKAEGYSSITASSFLFEFIMRIVEPEYSKYCDDIPGDEMFIVKEYAFISADGDFTELIDVDMIPEEYPEFQGVPEVVGADYEFDVKFVRSRGNGFGEILSALDDDEFIYKSEYNAAREYLKMMQEKQTIIYDKMFSLF
jgi:hypothetical protein